jgi:hypothetical protein
MSHPAEVISQTNLKIVNGKYDEAITSLTNILRKLKQYTSGDATIDLPIGLYNGEDSDRLGECDSSSSSSASFEYNFFSLPNVSSFLKTSDFIYSGDVSTPFAAQEKFQLIIFRDPIKALFCKPLDTKVCEQLAYVILYNLALSHHLKSFEPGTLSSETRGLRRAYLRKALSLYEHSRLIQMEAAITIGVEVVHSMALVSSLGHLYHELGYPQKAKICIQYLLSTMMYIIHCGELDILGNSVDGFFDMILPLITKATAAPAA